MTMYSISIDSRQAYILECLMNQAGTVTELAKATKVSKITIRRDLIELEKLGYIKRVFGGAVSVNGRTTVIPLVLRKQRNQEAKKAIARYAVTMISDGECIAMDTGSTILEMAEYMQNLNTSTVITTGFHCAGRLLSYPNIRVVLPGGILNSMEGALSGELAIQSLQSFYVDKFFLCVGAVDSSAGLTEHGLEDAQAKSIIISRAKENILVIDSSKFEKIAFKSVCGLDMISTVITDACPPPKLLEAFKMAGIITHIVSPQTGEVEIIKPVAELSRD